MRKFIMLLLVLMPSVCFAEVFIVVDKTSKEIITMSQKNDTVISSGQELVTLPGKFENIELTEAPSNYFYKNGKLVLNTKKINEIENTAEVQKQKDIEENKIKKQMRKSAIEQLKAAGENITATE